jgi:hypothetical protein
VRADTVLWLIFFLGSCLKGELFGGFEEGGDGCGVHELQEVFVFAVSYAFNVVFGFFDRWLVCRL